LIEPVYFGTVLHNVSCGVCLITFQIFSCILWPKLPSKVKSLHLGPQKLQQVTVRSMHRRTIVGCLSGGWAATQCQWNFYIAPIVEHCCSSDVVFVSRLWICNAHAVLSCFMETCLFVVEDFSYLISSFIMQMALLTTRL